LKDSSIDLLLETSEIVSLIITLTFSAVIVKLSNIGDRRYFYITYKNSIEGHPRRALFDMYVVYTRIKKWRNCFDSSALRPVTSKRNRPHYTGERKVHCFSC